MLRRSLEDEEQLHQLQEHDLLSFYNCEILRDRRMLAGLYEESLQELLPAFPAELRPLLTQHTKPGQRWHLQVVVVRLCCA